MELPVRLTGALVYASPAALKAAAKLQQATAFALPAGASLTGTRCEVDFDGTLSLDAWGHAVQALQTLAFNAASGAVAVTLTSLRVRYEVRAGGSVFPFVDERPTGSRYRLGSLSFRAPHAIGAMAVSPDGRRLALGTQKAPSDRERCLPIALARVAAGAAWGADEVRVWNLSTGELTHRVLGRSRAVYDLAFSPDGDRLACVSSEVASYPKKPGKVRQKYGQPVEMQAHLFDLRTGADVMLGKPGARVVAFSHDGALLAVSGEKATELYDAASTKLVAALDAVGREAALALSFSHDDRYLLTVTGNSEARTYDVASRKLAATVAHGCFTNTANGVFVPGTHTVFMPFRGAKGLFDAATGAPVTSALDGLDDDGWHGWALCDEARRELTLSRFTQRDVRRWRLPSGERVETAVTDLEDHATYQGTNLALDPRDGAILHASHYHGARVPERIDVTTGARATLDGMFPANATARFASNEVLCVQHGPTLRRVRADDGALLGEHTLGPHLSVCAYACDATAVYATRNQQLVLIDLVERAETTLPGARWGYFVTTSPSGARLAGQTVDANALRLLDLRSGALRDIEMNGRVSAIAFVDDDRVAVVLYAPEGKSLVLVDWARGVVTRTERGALGGLTAHDGVLTELDFLGRARVRDADLSVSIATHTVAEAPWTAHVAPGMRGAVLTSGNIVQVLSLAGDAPRETWSGAPHSGDVEWVAWSPDGRRFATLGTEGTALVWDAP